MNSQSPMLTVLGFDITNRLVRLDYEGKMDETNTHTVRIDRIDAYSVVWVHQPEGLGRSAESYEAFHLSLSNGTSVSFRLEEGSHDHDLFIRELNARLEALL